jgi:L-ascorbate metabolism protein UlaG (beta-lactamase superfamily)
MHMRLIRKATLRLELDGRHLLVDPMLDGELPEPAEVVVAGIDAVLVTQPDHFDDAAAALLPEDVPLLCRPEDAGRLRERGFGDVRPVEGSARLDAIEVTRRGSGYVLRDAAGRKLYVAGDTALDAGVEAVLDEQHPDVVVVNAGAGPMDAGDVVAVARLAPDARVVAVHLDTVEERADLHQALHEEGLVEQVTVPEDGAAVPVG